MDTDIKPTPSPSTSHRDGVSVDEMEVPSETCETDRDKYNLSDCQEDDEEDVLVPERKKGPPEVERRVDALAKIQGDIDKMRQNLEEEILGLEFKFAEMMKPLAAKRYGIVSGQYEPSDGECDLTAAGTPERDEVGLETSMENMAIKSDEFSMKGKISGVPGFWLSVLKRNSYIGSIIEKYDEPVLKYLEDITIDTLMQPVMGYKLNFHFSKKNTFFTNEVLTKTFWIQCLKWDPVLRDNPLLDVDDPLAFRACKSIGCEINWNKDCNITVSVRTCRRRTSGSDCKVHGVKYKTMKTTTKLSSFFNFFNTFDGSSDEVLDEMDEDFKIGEEFRKRIIPSAVVFYIHQDETVDNYDVPCTFGHGGGTKHDLEVTVTSGGKRNVPFIYDPSVCHFAPGPPPSKVKVVKGMILEDKV